jgi:hypothetical protein
MQANHISFFCNQSAGRSRICPRTRALFDGSPLPHFGCREERAILNRTRTNAAPKCGAILARKGCAVRSRELFTRAKYLCECRISPVRGDSYLVRICSPKMGPPCLRKRVHILAALIHFCLRRWPCSLQISGDRIQRISPARDRVDRVVEQLRRPPFSRLRLVLKHSPLDRHFTDRNSVPGGFFGIRQSRPSFPR